MSDNFLDAKSPTDLKAAFVFTTLNTQKIKTIFIAMSPLTDFYKNLCSIITNHIAQLTARFKIMIATDVTVSHKNDYLHQLYTKN